MPKRCLHRCARAVALLALIASPIACGSSSSVADAGDAGDAGDARADAATDSQLREDTCTYWPLDPGPSCGEAIYGSAAGCIEAIEPCADDELLGIGFCWESADERCDPSCLPACADDP